jgi:hypothetical protein
MIDQQHDRIVDIKHSMSGSHRYVLSSDEDQRSPLLRGIPPTPSSQYLAFIPENATHQVHAAPAPLALYSARCASEGRGLNYSAGDWAIQATRRIRQIAGDSLPRPAVAGAAGWE